MILQVKKHISSSFTISPTSNSDPVPIHVMIRPRGADFCYNSNEFEIMKSDIQICKDYGVNGVVFGILLPSGIIF